MQDENKHIDELFRDALGGYTEQPRPLVWEGIEKALVDNKEKKKRFFFRWYWFVSGLLLLVATGVITADVLKNNKRTTARYVKQVEDTGGHSRRGEKTGYRDAVPGQEDKNEYVEDEYKNATHNKNDEQKTQVKVVQGGYIAIPETGERNKVLTQANEENNATGDESAIDNMAEYIVPQYTLPETPGFTNEQSGGIVSVINTNHSIPVTLPEDKRRKPALTAPVNTDINRAEEQTTITGARLNQKLPAATALAAPQAAQEEVVSSSNEVLTTSPENKPVKKDITDSSSTNEQVAPTEEPVKKDRDGFGKNFEAGIKAGYQLGVSGTYSSGKFVVAGYVQYNLSKRIAIALQPAYLSGNGNTGSVPPDKRYYSIVSSSVDTAAIFSMSNNTRDPDTVRRSYYYTETYDSTTVSYGVSNKKLWDVELPLLLKYNITSHIAITGGPVVGYSKLIMRTENRTDYKGLTNDYTEDFPPVTYTSLSESPPPGPAPKKTSDLFPHTGESIDNYSPLNNSKAKGFTRFGYIIGLNATFMERWLLDILLQQMNANPSLVPDDNIRKMYAQPSIRVTIGYKLLK